LWDLAELFDQISTRRKEKEKEECMCYFIKREGQVGLTIVKSADDVSDSLAPPPLPAEGY
jgi:hypothetical protein